MFCNKKTFLFSLRVAVALVTLMCLAATLHAQNGSPSPTPVDPGPRPTGREPLISLGDPNAICPIPVTTTGHGTKFPETTCLDFAQPPSVPPAPTAAGAGGILAIPGNLGGTWFEALTVFETLASVDGTDNNKVKGKFIKGLGPSFNAESCFQCHSQPAVGGSSPGCVDVGSGTGTFCSNMDADPKTGVVTKIFNSMNNPQYNDGGDRNATNNIPDFIVDRQGTGPIVEVRFPKGANLPGVANLGNPATVQPGAVAEIYVIAGRSDAPAQCGILQENFAAQELAHNIIFRIAIPTFGDGFVENTPDTALDAAAGAAQSEASGICTQSPTCGISFHVFNLSGNDQTITRFGWKAQNKSLLMFAGEASNVEMGVTNELFPTERTYGIVNDTDPPVCTPNTLPEDVTQSLTGNQIEAITGPLNGNQGSDEPGVTSVISSNIENDAIFMRLNGAPSICNWNSGVSTTTGLSLCNAVDQSVLRGAALFGNSVLTPPAGTAPTPIGCVLCHWQQFFTAPSASGSLNNQPFSPFSDFALHHMGGLADNVQQGQALPDQFRTAPLWGLGQRLFFLHDGREPKNPPVQGQNALYDTIQDHCLPVPSGGTPSEACDVVGNFNSLPVNSSCPPNNPNCNCNTSACTASQEDLMHFLRSL